MTREELGIVASNLAALTGVASSAYERRLAHLFGLARSFRENLLSDAMRGDYLELTAAITAAGSDSPSDKSFYKFITRSDRFELCRFICSLLGQGEKLSAEALLDRRSAEGIADATDEPIRNRVCYLRNYYADRAYNIFSTAIDEPTVMYSTDFAGVCEDVYYGRAKYCILPVENSSDGMLTGFRTLIGKYDLNMALTCDVRTQQQQQQEEDAYTRFALLRRGIGSPIKIKGSRRFEFTVTFDENGATLCDIIDAADAFGLRLDRINSLPASYSGRSSAYDLIFTCQGEGLPEFITFLSLEAPQFTVVGIYPHIAVNQ
jgi:hypothetical protein